MDVPSVLAPKQNTNRLTSDTSMKFCFVGVLEAPAKDDSSTARVVSQLVASQ